jgi:hypothetical protein
LNSAGYAWKNEKNKGACSTATNGTTRSYFLMAFLIFAIMSGGTVFMLCTDAACAEIFFINSSSVAAVASKGQSNPMSLHLKEGKKFT